MVARSTATIPLTKNMSAKLIFKYLQVIDIRIRKTLPPQKQKNNIKAYRN